MSEREREQQAEENMEFRIRKARIDDAPLLSAFLRSLDLLSRLREEPEENTARTVIRNLAQALESPSHSIYIAVDSDNAPIGYVSVHWLPYLIFSGPEGFVSELFIGNSARGRGIGTALLNAVESEAKERGCSRLQLINFRNRESYRRRFYEKAGWEERPDAADFVRKLDN